MLSIVLPAYNEERHIAACLDSLARQRTRRTFEVIVVDNDSTDDTRGIAETFRSELHLRIITVRKRRRGTARHAGFEAADGDVIFSTDADTVLPPDWIERCMKRLEPANVVAVTGPYRISDCSRITNAVYNLWLPFWIRCCKLMTGHYLFRGGNFAIKRAAYDEAGKFDAEADAHEDAELSRRVSRCGLIVYAPETRIEASGRRFKRGLLQGAYDYATSLFGKFFQNRSYVRLSDVR